MKKQWIVSAVAVIALIVVVLVVRARVHFDWHVFGEQLRQAHLRGVAAGIGLIYAGYVLRALRWALFVKPTRKVSPFSLLGTQVIGFSAVALLGRPADLVRPYLVSRKLKLPLSSQLAVWVVERMFDVAAMALIFSAVMLLARNEHLPHPELLKRTALSGLVLTFAMAVFTVVIRLSGNAVATAAQAVLRPISPKLGLSVADKIRAFRNGLDTLKTSADVALAFGLSLAMWGLISGAYFETTRAFVASPQLASMTLARCMVLMAASMVASSLTLPVIGWFTSIGIAAGTMTSFFGVAPEPALGCAAMLLIVTFMSVVPVGLIWAQFEHVSLRKISEESEHAADERSAGSIDERSAESVDERSAESLDERGATAENERLRVTKLKVTE